MEQNIMEILCCPLCKGELKLEIKTKSNEKITEGSMVCSNCKNEYSIHEGIPRMFIPDNEIIAFSNNPGFLKFIVTPETLDEWIRSNKTRISSGLLTNKILTAFLVGSGWALLFFSIPVLVMSYFNYNLAMAGKVPLPVIYLLTGISVMFFAADYFSYRESARMEFSAGIHTLKKLSDKQKLSEYDIRASTKDREENFQNEFENQRDFVAYKGKIIRSILDEHNFKVKKALNVGCGGALHRSVSKPYFDKGYNMIGADISEEYLKQFNRIFDTDVVQVNSMALPFRSNSFDLMNFTDIVEHLHHPLLGLSEAQRVLNEGGAIIITTNNQCVFVRRCINPLVFIEKALSLYHDGILPPRKILGSWMDFNFYHTEFSKNEITGLLKAAGFGMLSFGTQFPNKYLLNMLINKLPVLKSMGGEFIITGVKNRRDPDKHHQEM